MKIIEKNCPNCGASIEITEGQRIFKCKYCGTTLERDRNEELEIRTKETALNVFKGIFAYMGMMQIISTVIFLIVFLFIIIIAVYGFTHI